LGEHLRRLIGKEFPQGEASAERRDESLARQFSAVERLANDQHVKAWPSRFANATSTGLGHEEIKQVVSPSKAKLGTLKKVLVLKK
jgi:hypothetical protein